MEKASPLNLHHCEATLSIWAMTWGCCMSKVICWFLASSSFHRPRARVFLNTLHLGFSHHNIPWILNYWTSVPFTFLDHVGCRGSKNLHDWGHRYGLVGEMPLFWMFCLDIWAFCDLPLKDVFILFLFAHFLFFIFTSLWLNFKLERMYFACSQLGFRLILEH